MTLHAAVLNGLATSFMVVAGALAFAGQWELAGGFGLLSASQFMAWAFWRDA